MKKVEQESMSRKERKKMERKKKIMKSINLSLVGGLIIPMIVPTMAFSAPKTSNPAEQSQSASAMNDLIDENQSPEGDESAMQETQETTTESETESTEIVDEKDSLFIEENSDTSEEVLEGEETVEAEPTLDEETIKEDIVNRAVTTGKWGTAPVKFDTETGILTVDAGTIGGVSSGFEKNDVKKVIFSEGVVAPENSTLLFFRWANVTSIKGNLDTSKVTDMRNMFAFCTSLTELDVSDWDTSQVTDMAKMFTYCTSLTELDVSGWNTSKVTNMWDMFYNCTSLTELDVSDWDTSKVTDMYGMFFGCTSLTELDVSDWDTSKVTDTAYMFPDCASLTELDVSGWNTSEVTNMRSMFSGCTSLTELDVSGWDTSKVTDMSSMFFWCDNLKKLTLGRQSIFNSKSELPSISGSEYTGRWERIEPAVPKVVYENSRDFMGNYDGTEPGVYVWQKKETDATVTVKDSTLYVGDTWTAADNFVSATDKDGNPVTISGVTVSGTVDTTVAGIYKVTYSYGGVTEIATITVLENQTNIEAKDSTIYVGTSWSASDNFVSATDKDGNNIPFEDVTVAGAVDPTKVGEYEVTYSYNGKTAKATITVVAGQTTLSVKDSTLYVGDTWTAADNFVSATDKDGNPVTISGVTVSGTVDTAVAGIYEVTYSFDGLDKVATITVLENQTNIEAKDSTIYVGTSWSASDNFVSATDKDGNNVPFEEVTVTGAVDPTKVGEYEVTYSYNGKAAKAKIIVVADQATLAVKDSTLYVGDTWTAADNFVLATDKDGNPVTISEVTVSGTVDTTVAGTYEVTYSYGGVTEIATITVLKNQTSIVGKDSTISVNTPWTAKDNFVGATDKDGNNVDFSEVTVSGAVDTKTLGDYEITYSYGGQSTTITVTVVADQTTLVVKDSTIYVNTPWTAEDNFISATDKNGNVVDFSNVTVIGSVDRTKPGKYEVTYSYNGLTQVATITVIPVSVPPVTPTEPSIPVKPSVKPVLPAVISNVLPKTGEQKTVVATIAGMGLLALAFVLKRRKKS